MRLLELQKKSTEVETNSFASLISCVCSAS